MQKTGDTIEIDDIDCKDEGLSLLGLSETKKGILFFEDIVH